MLRDCNQVSICSSNYETLYDTLIDKNNFGYDAANATGKVWHNNLRGYCDLFCIKIGFKY